MATLTLLGIVVVLASAVPASAHTGDQSYLYLDVTATSLSGRVELPSGDLRAVLGFGLDGTDEQVVDELRSKRRELEEYLTDHVVFVGPDGRAWPIVFDAAELLVGDTAEENVDYVVVPFKVVVGGEVPRRFEVQFSPFFDELFGRAHLLFIQNDWRAGVFDGNEVLLTFYPGTPTQVADLGDTSRWETFRASVGLGIQHIETGPDHILFLLALLLPSVLVWEATGWRPTAGFSAALWRILKIVTTFTVAHSITFSLAGLQVLPLPPARIVESIIGLSIVATCLHNLRPVIANREWVVSFTFGLFHGMGFASLTSALDVSPSTQLLTLLGRNVGIEIAQAIVVLLLFPVLFLLRRLDVYRVVFVVFSVVLAVVAVGWTLERALGLDLSVDSLVDPIFVYPRVVVIVVLCTVGAAALWLVEERNDRLLPVRSPPQSASTSATSDEA